MRFVMRGYRCWCMAGRQVRCGRTMGQRLGRAARRASGLAFPAEAPEVEGIRILFINLFGGRVAEKGQAVLCDIPSYGGETG